MGKNWSTFAAICIAAATAAPLRAEVVSDLAPFIWDSARPHVLTFEGEITRRTPPLLGRALGRFETVEVLELASPGGDAYAAMAMVPTIRAAGLATRIEAGAKCHSACSFLYFAGTARAADGELGVHQLASANEASGHFIMNDVLDVFSDLGVPDMVRRRMMQTPPSEMYVFSPDELVALGLVGPAEALAAADPELPVAVPPAPPVTAAPAEDPAETTPAETTPADPVQPVAAAPDAAAAPATHIALDIAGEANGRVVIELYDEIAPDNAARLVTLARDGAYDGVVFHRVIDGFMAQTGDVAFGKAGGDLARAGTGGSSYPDLKAEFSDKPFVAGTVGMARSSEPDSANAQFFIMFEPAPYLAGSYTVVGQVVEGLDVVQAIKRGGGDNGGVTEAPDRILRAVALSAEGAALPRSQAIARDDAALPRAVFETRFDFTDPDLITLNIGWTLPAALASLMDCSQGETRTLQTGFTQCELSFSEPAGALLNADPSGGIALTSGDDGSRRLTVDVAQFIAPVTPSAEVAAQLKDTPFSLIVAADRVVETTGVAASDGTTATLTLTMQEIMENAETIPATFTTRFF